MAKNCELKVTLEIPSLDLRDSYVESLKDFQKEDPQRPINWEMFEDFQIYLKWWKEAVDGSTDRVPQTTYWIVCDQKTAAGKLSIRPKLNPRLEMLGGHFGYEIRPAYRKKGIATVALALGLKRIKELGVNNAFVTCDVDNLGSIGVLENNGGKLIATYEVEGSPKPIRKYQFTL